MKQLLIALLLLSAANLARAQESDTELTKRQDKATKIINDVGAIDRSAGYYKVALEQYFQGPNGIKQSTEHILQEFHNIVTELNHAANFARVVDEPSLQATLRGLDMTFSNNAQKFAELLNEIRKQQQPLKRLEALVKQADQVPQAKDTDLAKISSSVKQSAETTLTSAKALHKSLEDRASDIGKMLTIGRNAIIERLRLALLRQGLTRLQTALNTASDAMTYTTELVPKVLEIETHARALSRYASELAYFGAESERDAVRNKCAHFAVDIAAIHVTDAARQKALQRKEQLCAAVERDWNALADLGSRVELIAQYAKVQEQKLAPHCATTTNATINCEKLAVLRATTRQDLNNMTDAQLKFYENAWREVALGL